MAYDPFAPVSPYVTYNIPHYPFPSATAPQQDSRAQQIEEDEKLARQLQEQL